MWRRRPDTRSRVPDADPSNPVLSFDGVCVAYGNKQVLDDLNLQVPGHGITVVVGPSGSGKSTLARLCNRLIDPSNGTVSFRGVNMRELPVLDIRREVGLVFQRPAVFSGTVTDNLSASGIIDAKSQATALAAVGLADPDMRDREAATLSGGESQRLCLARTLLTKPEVLVADEPTASLDPNSAETLEELARQTARSGRPLLWLTHDLGQLDRLADHAVVLIDGRVRATGSAAEVRHSEDADVREFLESLNRSAQPSPNQIHSPTRPQEPTEDPPGQRRPDSAGKEH